MRVLAIDPGFGRCGVAILDRDNSGGTILLYSACLETRANSSFIFRLEYIAKEIVKLIDTYQPNLIAIEEIYFNNNQKTVFRVAEIRGMIMYLAVSRSIEIVEYNPLSIKVAVTGQGRASKEQVAKMVSIITRHQYIPFELFFMILNIIIILLKTKTN